MTPNAEKKEESLKQRSRFIEFGLISGEETLADVEDHLSPDQRKRHREIVFRHSAQVAFAEWVRLRDTLPEVEEIDENLFTRMDQLISLAEDTCEDNSSSRAIQFLRSARLRLAGQYKDAKEIREKALSLKPRDDVELYLEAIRLMALNQWQASSELLASLADRGAIPSSLRWTMLGRSQFYQAEFEAAKVSFTQSIEHSPKSASLRLLRGMCYQKLGRPKFAEADFSAAIDLNPEFYSAWYDRGLSRLNQDRLQEGVSDLSRALLLSPGQVQALLVRSRAYRKLGMTEAADRDFDAALRSENVNVSALISRAIALMDVDPHAAVKDLERADVMKKDNRSVLLNLSIIQGTRLGMRDEAVRTLTRLLNADPEHDEARVDRAVHYVKLGKYALALDDVQKALKDRNSGRTLYQAACVYALLPSQRNYPYAVSLLARAVTAGYRADHLESDPDLVELRDLPGFDAVKRFYQLSRSRASRSKTRRANLSDKDNT